MSQLTPKYPFSGIFGQAQFKFALMLVAVNPLVSGVLISGPRGCAKSTLSRALADILPSQSGQAHPFVTLPLGATEEMLIGTLNLQQVLDQQQVKFQPGLLSKAHNGVLYVDEINLLSDNLVDQLLDVAASGVNVVERDGISHQHAAEFVLLGTMNPDEGELRPQLTDRFGLSVQLSNQFSLEERIEIVQLRERFDQNPQEFQRSFSSTQNQLINTINDAQKLLPTILCSKQCRLIIAERCSEAQVDGLRADIVWVQAARAAAALANRNEVTEQDVTAVEEFVLSHRRKVNTSSKPHNTPNTVKPPFSRPEEKTEKSQDGDWGAMEPVAQKTQDIVKFETPPIAMKTSAIAQKIDQTVQNKRRGKARGQRNQRDPGKKINWFSTFVANSGHWPLKNLAFNPLRQGKQMMHLILLDTSGSVLANSQFAQAKGLILQIAQTAYLKREQIGIIGFGNESVQTLLPVTRAPKDIRHMLDAIKAAGGTPLHKGLEQTVELQRQLLNRSPGTEFNTYIITDGRIKEDTKPYSLLGNVVVVDVEHTQVKRGKAKKIAQALNAHYQPLLA